MHAPAGLRGKLQRACKGPAQRDPLNAGMPRPHVVPSPSQPKSSFLSFSLLEEATSCSGRLPSMLSRMSIALGFWGVRSAQGGQNFPAWEAAGGSLGQQKVSVRCDKVRVPGAGRLGRAWAGGRKDGYAGLWGGHAPAQQP